MGNRLRSAQSTYLRQHADNPVDWWPWGPEAFAEARRREVPVFISIGYAACHWCHVMAGESFEDELTAALLNERFLAIKVDREEHPEVDDAYMAATQALSGQGGWPMSVFTTPQGQVFHAGTYFPPQRMGQVPSFTQVCEAVWEAWTQRREQVETQAAKIAAALGDQRRRQGQLATAVDLEASAGAEQGIDRQRYQEIAHQALAALQEQHDDVHGGFGAAPKFPPSPLLDWLLEDPAGFTLAEPTMTAMARSALFDQVEGGFARYATDRAWALPHFEKMLYDNAQLVGSYATLSVHPQATPAIRSRAERTARMTINWLHQRMLTEEGLLASSLDADTVDEAGNHTEGGTYLFSDAELTEAALAVGLDGQQAARLTELNYGVPADAQTAASGQQAHLTEFTPRTLHFDAPLGDADGDLWEAVVAELVRRRTARAQPARDDKVVAAWNAQAVRALVEAAMVWGDEEILDAAESLAHRLWQIHARPAHTAATHQSPALQHVQIARTSYAGEASVGPGTLADHCHTASACFALASAGRSSATWIQRGLSALRAVLTEFVSVDQGKVTVIDSLDPDGLLTEAQDGAADASPVDDPEPSSIAALLHALQQAEALGLSTQLPVNGSSTALSPQQLLHHLPVLAPQAPIAVGGSLLPARRAVLGSPAFRVFSGTAADLAAIRRASALYGFPIEPVEASAITERAELRVSICLNSPAHGICLAPSSSISAAVAQLD